MIDNGHRHAMIFDAVSEDIPGPKWRKRWERSWPEYQKWMASQRDYNAPPRAEYEAAMAKYMPEIQPLFRKLVNLAGNGSDAACFLSGWCPPQYLAGCSVAAMSDKTGTKLVRNYDLSPDLNEGLLLRTAMTGMPVMGMVEFLWGLSDGINGAGLAVAIAYGGRPETARGFGITTILRYVLETCETVGDALQVLIRVPSHMAYNVTLADRHGTTASVELQASGGLRQVWPAVSTNHQSVGNRPANAALSQTYERREHLQKLVAGNFPASRLSDAFIELPLFQNNFCANFGTLFTAEYDPRNRSLALRWRSQTWKHTLAHFSEGTRHVVLGEAELTSSTIDPTLSFYEIMGHHLKSWLAHAERRNLDCWIEQSKAGSVDWAAFGEICSHRRAHHSFGMRQGTAGKNRQSIGSITSRTLSFDSHLPHEGLSCANITARLDGTKD